MGRKAKIKAQRAREKMGLEGSSLDVSFEPLPGGGVRQKMSFRGDAADHAGRLWLQGKLNPPSLLNVHCNNEDDS